MLTDDDETSILLTKSGSHVIIRSRMAFPPDRFQDTMCIKQSLKQLKKSLQLELALPAAER